MALLTQGKCCFTYFSTRGKKTSKKVFNLSFNLVFQCIRITGCVQEDRCVYSPSEVSPITCFKSSHLDLTALSCTGFATAKVALIDVVKFNLFNLSDDQ